MANPKRTNGRPLALAGFDGGLNNTKQYHAGDDDHPVFCFRYAHPDFTVQSKRLDLKSKGQMLERLYALSQMSWQDIRLANKHGYGTEKMPFSSIKPARPQVMPGDGAEAEVFESLLVFRRDSKNHVFAGVRVKSTIHILYVEAAFGDLYNHD